MFPKVEELPDEAFLRALGIHRVPVPIPFIEAGGPVNVYFLEDAGGGYTLFDCGLGTAEAEAAFRRSAAERGLDLGRLNRIVVSHGHVDHFGLAQTLSEQTGATVHVHPADRRKLTEGHSFDGRVPLYRAYFARMGVEPAQVDQLVAMAEASKDFTRPVEESRLESLHAGDRLSFARFEAEVLHSPGHTPGLVCLHDPEHRLLFADDHLLAKVSPNPLLELGPLGEEDKFRSLCAYLESARRVYALELDAVLPGHGGVFRGHRGLLDSLFSFYTARQERMLARLAKGEATAVELVGAVFGRSGGMRLFLTLSEIIGNLEVLEQAQRVSRRLDDGVYRYAASSD